jgi:hypothetical protein
VNFSVAKATLQSRQAQAKPYHYDNSCKSMIINGTTVIITLVCIGIVGYVGLQLIRQFAFSIALENHESNMALDVKEDQQRQKKIELADKAVSDAFIRVEPLISKKEISRSNTPVGEKVNIV